MDREKINNLKEKARLLRRDVLQMTYEAHSGHPGGSCSLADVMAYLYFEKLRYDTANPKAQDRDRVILSKGHGAPVLYAALAEAGFFDMEELHHLREIGHLLQGHPSITIPGVDAATGSLGLGLSIGTGMALAARLEGLDSRIYVIMGDGELGEGQIWEAAMAAPKFGLNHLTAILDRNRYQNDGPTEEILPLEPLADKWRAFRWHVIETDGHNFEEIDRAFGEAEAYTAGPSLILARTVKGKGASYLLDQPSLHYTPPTREQLEGAMAELGFAVSE